MDRIPKQIALLVREFDFRQSFRHVLIKYGRLYEDKRIYTIEDTRELNIEKVDAKGRMKKMSEI